MKKLIAFITATVLLTSGITASAKTVVQGKWVHFPFTNVTSDLAPGEYAIPGTDAKWVYENHEANGKRGRSKITTTNAATGERALYLFAQNDDATVYDPGAKMTIHWGELTGDGTYHVQFDMMPWDPDYRDFVALNMDRWDSAARIKDGEGTIWEKGPAFQGSKHGDNRDFYTYTGTVSTENDPELSFAVWGYSRMTIDNIIITDSTGKVVFSEDFEEYDEEDMLPDYECLEYGIFSDGEEVDSIEGSTDYEVKASIVNNKIDDGIDAQIIAILRKDGEMVDIQGSGVVTVEKDSTDTDGTDISTTISVGDVSDGEYELSIYLWDGLGTMKIIESSKLYTEGV